MSSEGSYETAYAHILAHERIQMGGEGNPPPEKSQNIGFLCNTGPDPLKNHKATKPAFNVGLVSARQRIAISMVFRWRANGGPFQRYLDPLSPIN